ncbi:helicase associated domain-containing protein [Gryllotalpicola protaetiae]|uniref:helicase associated domain-containing protein n=1 Tax=Gryllotalpicola protaetiae TaxID=2419771 RepID=UPI003CCC5804
MVKLLNCEQVRCLRARASAANSSSTCAGQRGASDPVFAEWEEQARCVVAFTEEHRASPTRTPSDRQTFALGEWLKKQRVRAREGTLVPERRHWLNENLPGWEGATYDDRFRG